MRVLAICCFSFAAAVLAAALFLPLAALLWIALLLSVLGLGLCLLKRRWLRGLILCMFSLAFGLGYFYGHAQLTVERAHHLDEETVELRGKILEEPRIYESYTSLVLRPESGAPRLTTVLYCNDGSLNQLRPGDRISCTAKLRTADLRFNKKQDRYAARDIYFLATAKGQVSASPTVFDLETAATRLGSRLARSCDMLFPEDTAAFAKSLILGDKSDLYQDLSLYVALSRAGLMHIVAVSGMHVAFLVSMIRLFFGKGRKSAITSAFLVWLFVLMTGAGPSAVRAGLMQTMLLLAPILGRENDTPTSLAAALGLILLLNPFAILSVSLQLSFGAMAGILLLTERVNSLLLSHIPEGRLFQPLRVLAGIAASSLGAMIFTVPLTAIYFGTVAVLSPLSNLLCLWCVSACFCLTLGAALLGLLIPAVGLGLAWLASWLMRYIFLIARLISAIPFGTVYTEGELTLPWLVFTYLLFGVTLCSRIRPLWRFALPAALSLLALLGTMALVRWQYESLDGVFTAVDVGQGQSLAILSEDKTVVVDCGGIYSSTNAGQKTGAYLLSRGRKRVDALVLTHLHADHCNGVEMLLELIPIEQIILPEDVEDEDGLLSRILNAAQRHGTEIIWLSRDSFLQLGKITLRLFAPLDSGDANERCVTGVVSIGDTDMLFTGDAPKAVEKALVETKDLRDLEILIVGHHGSRYSSSGELLGSIGADRAVISVGENGYGHPTGEVLQRLLAYGYTIYRTDVLGTVEMRLG